MSSEAGKNLAEGVRASTAYALPLARLELQGNKLDGIVGRAIAAALHGNCRLINVNLANNPLDADSMAQLKLANEAVLAAWKRSDEGKRAAAQSTSGQRVSKAAGFLGDVLSALA